MFQFLFWVLFMIGLIYGAHQCILYVQTKYIPKVSRNKYHSQIEKYQDLVRELQQEYEEKENMEDDLFHYVDIQTQNGVNNREEN